MKGLTFPDKSASGFLQCIMVFGLVVSAAAQTYVNRFPNASGDGYYIAIKEISAAETWTKAGSPYIVDVDQNFDNCGVNILAGGSLTIQAGVEVHYMYGRGHASLIVRGTLNAQGTAVDPIIFNPAAGGYSPEWGGIQCLGGSSVSLSYVTINNAGHVNSGWQTGFVGAALYIDSCAPTILNCTIDSSRNDGIKINTGAAPVITDCIVNNCAAYAANWVDVATSAPVISGLLGAGNTYQGIAIGAGVLKKNATLAKNGIPWYLTGYDDNLVVDTGITLTIAAGAVIKSNYGRSGGALVVNDGVLNCAGTAGDPIIFTSYLDDSVAGDFSKADTAKPYKGVWSGLRFYNGAQGTLTYVKIKYSGHVASGWQGWHPAAAIYLMNASPTFTNVDILDAEGAGIKFPLSAAVFTNCTITRSGGWAAIQEGDSLKSIPSFSGVTALANAVNGIGVFGVLGNNVTFTDNPLAYVIDGWLTVPAGKKLTVDPGAVVKSIAVGNSYKSGLMIQGGSLDASGTEAKPIIFTSIADDSAKGNTDNNDTLKPAAADWNGIIAQNSANLIMKWCHINYGGYANEAWGTPGGSGISAANSALAISDCSINNTGKTSNGAGGNGISVSNCTGTVTSSAINSSLAAAIRINAPLQTVPAFSGTTARGCAYNAFAFNGAVTGKIILPADSIPYYLDGRCSVADSASLTFGSGAIVKTSVLNSSWERDIMVAGAFIARGTAQKPIVFTTILDDSVGGPTSADTAQPLSSGSGDWEGIAFVDSLARGTFENCLFKYGGYGNSYWNGYSGGMIYILHGTVSVNKSGFYGGRGGNTHGGAGVYMNGGSLSGSHNTISNCSHGIYADGKIDSASFMYSDFSAITGFGARASDSTHRIDASHCWWDSASGPSGAGPGTGVKVSSYVVFLPYAAGPVSGATPAVPPSLLVKSFKPFMSCRQGYDGRLVLRYALSESGPATFIVYSIAGRAMYSFRSMVMPLQSRSVVLPLLPNGKYLYRFRSQSIKVDNMITCLH